MLGFVVVVVDVDVVVVVEVEVVVVLVLVVVDVVVDATGNVPDVCGAVTVGCVVGVVVTERFRGGTVVWGVDGTAAFTAGRTVVVVGGTVVGGTVLVVVVATKRAATCGEFAGFPVSTSTAPTTRVAATTVRAAVTIRNHAARRGSSSSSTKCPPWAQNSLAVSSGDAPCSRWKSSPDSGGMAARCSRGTISSASAGNDNPPAGGNSSRMWKSISSWSSMPPKPIPARRRTARRIAQ